MFVNILLTSLSERVIGKMSRGETFGLGRTEHVGERDKRIYLDGTRRRSYISRVHLSQFMN